MLPAPVFPAFSAFSLSLVNIFAGGRKNRRGVLNCF
jgi:hypothetical protein